MRCYDIVVSVYNLKLFQDVEQRLLLSKGARGKHFSNEVEGSAFNIDPRCMEFHDGFMIKFFEEMDF